MRPLIFLAVLLFPAVLHAQTEPATAIVETMSSTMSVQGVSISSSVATSVVGSTGTANRFVTILNLDATANLFCGERTTITTSITSVLGGFRITPGQSVFFAIVPRSNFYCKNDGGSGATWASVARGR